MLACRVFSKKTKPIISSTTNCLASQSRSKSSPSSPSSSLLRAAVITQHHGNGFSRSFSILSSVNSNLIEESSSHRSTRFYRLRTFFSSNAKPEDSVPAKEGKDKKDDTATEIPVNSSDDDLSPEELLKLVSEKDQLLEAKQEELQDMKDKALRTCAEMENVMVRTRREAENSKKFAVQNFAKSLLDVADNLGRASSVVKESFAKIDQSKDAAGAVPLLKTLLEGVDMTDKQLGEVFKKFGVEKYDPLDEQFDPNRHNAAFQVPDASKPPGTVAAVLKPGYMLYDRVIRPAEVGVTLAVETNETEQGSEA